MHIVEIQIKSLTKKEKLAEHVQEAKLPRNLYIKSSLLNTVEVIKLDIQIQIYIYRLYNITQF